MDKAITAPKLADAVASAVRDLPAELASKPSKRKWSTCRWRSSACRPANPALHLNGHQAGFVAPIVMTSPVVGLLNLSRATRSSLSSPK